MPHNLQLEFFRNMLQGLHISSCLVTEPARYIPDTIDLGLRRALFGTQDYAHFLENDILQAQPHTVYCFFDEYDCKYIFLQLPDTAAPAFLFIGPYLLQIPSRKWLQQRGKLLGLDREQQQHMELYYTGLPILEDETWLLSMTGTLAATLYGPEQPYSVEYVQYMIPDRYTPIPVDSAARSIHDPELDLHTLEQNYASEKLLMDAVSQGKLHLLTTAATSYNSGAQPRLTDSLRDRKNYLIILKTLLRKAAEYGGVHPLHIHRMSARFAEDIENTRTVKQSLRLQEEMIRSYCLLVKHQSLRKYSYYVGQVITLVQYDLTADLSLKAIAAQLNVNASYLSDLFHREYGCTLSAFIRQERIRHGLQLLQATGHPVQQIAAECGFQDAAYFIKCFKQRTGLTPNQYREQVRKPPAP